MTKYIRAFAKQRKDAHARADAHMLPLDLFGEVAVTTADLRLWLAHLGMDPDNPRARWYVDAYDVAEKVRQAKRRGHWPP